MEKYTHLIGEILKYYGYVPYVNVVLKGRSHGRGCGYLTESVVVVIASGGHGMHVWDGQCVWGGWGARLRSFSFILSQVQHWLVTGCKNNMTEMRKRWKESLEGLKNDSDSYICIYYTIWNIIWFRSHKINENPTQEQTYSIQIHEIKWLLKKCCNC